LIKEEAIHSSLMRASIRAYLRLIRMTFFGTQDTFARLSFRRVAVMMGFLPPFLLLQAIHWIGFALDDLLFPGYRKVEIREPLFIVGVPRSGTTFLHRVLAGDRARFTTPVLWELVFAPSIVEHRIWTGLGRMDKRLGRPFGRMIDRLEERLFAPLDAIHPIRLGTPEEDYYGLAPILACLLLVLPFPSAQQIWRLSRFDEEVSDTEQHRILAFYRSLLQRHLYVRGTKKQLLSKNPSFTPMLRSLAAAFPDARFVGCVRNPLKAIPSELSAMTQGARFFGIDTKKGAFQEQFLELMIYYYQHLLAELPKLGPDRHVFALLETMKSDIVATVRRVYDRFGWSLDQQFEARLQVESERAKTYQSRHRYATGSFSVSPETITRRTKSVFKRFNYPLPEESNGHDP
jgi:hypothetical protein